MGGTHARPCCVCLSVWTTDPNSREKPRRTIQPPTQPTEMSGETAQTTREGGGQQKQPPRRYNAQRGDRRRGNRRSSSRSSRSSRSGRADNNRFFSSVIPNRHAKQKQGNKTNPRSAKRNEERVKEVGFSFGA